MKASRIYLRTSRKAEAFSIPQIKKRAPRNDIDASILKKRGESHPDHFMRICNKHLFEVKNEAAQTSASNERKFIARTGAMGLPKKFVPYQHPDIANDVLKSVDFVFTPSGQQVKPETFSGGKTIGLMFFSDSPRCHDFMIQLEKFQKLHSERFVVVAISVAETEKRELTAAMGFHHIIHKHGSDGVIRDVDLKFNMLKPLPRLVIVDPNSFHEVCSCGVTAVKVRPETCLDDWEQGFPGCYFSDFPWSWF